MISPFEARNTYQAVTFGKMAGRDLPRRYQQHLFDDQLPH
jgi:hypothetical protein